MVLGYRCPGELEQPQHTRKNRHRLLMRQTIEKMVWEWPEINSSI